MNNEEKILEMLKELKAAQDEMKAAQDEMKAAQDEMKAAQDEMKAAQDEMKAAQIMQSSQLTRMEERLDALDARSLHSAVVLETDVARDIRLVFEGQELLRQKVEELAPKDRIEALEGDVAMMKDVIKLIARRSPSLRKPSRLSICPTWTPNKTAAHGSA